MPLVIARVRKRMRSRFPFLAVFENAFGQVRALRHRRHQPRSYGAMPLHCQTIAGVAASGRRAFNAFDCNTKRSTAGYGGHRLRHVIDAAECLGA